MLTCKADDRMGGDSSARLCRTSCFIVAAKASLGIDDGATLLDKKKNNHDLDEKKKEKY